MIISYASVAADADVAVNVAADVDVDDASRRHAALGLAHRELSTQWLKYIHVARYDNNNNNNKSQTAEQQQAKETKNKIKIK